MDSIQFPYWVKFCLLSMIFDFYLMERIFLAILAMFLCLTGCSQPNQGAIHPKTVSVVGKWKAVNQQWIAHQEDQGGSTTVMTTSEDEWLSKEQSSVPILELLPDAQYRNVRYDYSRNDSVILRGLWRQSGDSIFMSDFNNPDLDQQGTIHFISEDIIEIRGPINIDVDMIPDDEVIITLHKIH